MTAARKPLPPYPRTSASSNAAGSGEASIRSVQGFLAAQERMLDELDVALAVALKRADERRDVQDRVAVLAKAARGQRR